MPLQELENKQKIEIIEDLPETKEEPKKRKPEEIKNPSLWQRFKDKVIRPIKNIVFSLYNRIVLGKNYSNTVAKDYDRARDEGLIDGMFDDGEYTPEDLTSEQLEEEKDVLGDFERKDLGDMFEAPPIEQKVAQKDMATILKEKINEFSEKENADKVKLISRSYVLNNEISLEKDKLNNISISFKGKNMHKDFILSPPYEEQDIDKLTQEYQNFFSELKKEREIELEVMKMFEDKSQTKGQEVSKSDDTIVDENAVSDIPDFGNSEKEKTELENNKTAEIPDFTEIEKENDVSSKFLPMEYSDDYKEPKTLAEQDINGFHCYVVSLGHHPCIYFDVTGTEYEGKDCDEFFDEKFTFPREITFSDCEVDFIEDKSKWLIGCDYCQLGDYNCNRFNGSKLDTDKKWTTEEMLNDCYLITQSLNQGLNKEEKSVEEFKNPSVADVSEIPDFNEDEKSSITYIALSKDAFNKCVEKAENGDKVLAQTKTKDKSLADVLFERDNGEDRITIGEVVQSPKNTKNALNNIVDKNKQKEFKTAVITTVETMKTYNEKGDYVVASDNLTAKLSVKEEELTISVETLSGEVKEATIVYPPEKSEVTQTITDLLSQPEQNRTADQPLVVSVAEAIIEGKLPDDDSLTDISIGENKTFAEMLEESYSNSNFKYKDGEMIEIEEVEIEEEQQGDDFGL